MAGWRFQPYFAGLSRDTVLVTCAGLLADTSTEMLSPVLPVFLTQMLHASGSIVGLVDGVAQATRNIVDGFAGALSDRLRTRKPIALAGFGLSALAKPLMGLSPVWQGVLGARLLDRFGAGIRSAPRDALVASSMPRQQRGRAFGAEGFGDNAGAFLGPVLAVLLLYVWDMELRAIFYIAVVPGILAWLTLMMVKENVPVAPKARVEVGPRQLPRPYWRYLLAVAVFGLGNSSDSFLILRTQELGAPLPVSVLIYAGFNLSAALTSPVAGWLSDLWGRKAILLGSFAVFAIAYAGFGLTDDLLTASALFIFYGLYQGMFRAAGKALAADFVPPHLRASGIGWYSTTVGLLQLAASLIAGLLWDDVGHPSVFLYGAALGAVAVVTLMVLVPRSPVRS